MVSMLLYCVADEVCSVSGGGATEEEGGGAHSDTARDRRHQQSHTGLPRPLLRSEPITCHGTKSESYLGCVLHCICLMYFLKKLILKLF